MIACIAEDRAWCETPVKLLLLSLTEHCPGLAVELFYPPADDAFVQWLRRCPQVRLNREPLQGAYSWNVKPHALLSVLERGHSDALWLDSDIIVARNFLPRFAGMDPDLLCVTEDALLSGNRLDEPPRAAAWGFEVGRKLPFAANTAVLRVTSAHVPLLEKWRELLESDAYRAAQQVKTGRPGHMFGDQDVLTALLASRPFAHVPLRFLTRGRDVIHQYSYHGYTCAERCGNMLHGLPPFIHAQVNKPWVPRERQRMTLELKPGYLIKWLTCVYVDSSPYLLLAEKYRSDIEGDTSWIRPRTITGRLLRLLGFWLPQLVGFPIAILADLIRLRKRLARHGTACK